MPGWYRSPDVAFESLGEDVHLLDLGNLDVAPSPRALEGPAAVIWRSLGSREEPFSEDEVVHRVADHFGLDDEDVRRQTVAFLQDLSANGLARSAGSTED